jgi:hypothetical protein
VKGTVYSVLCNKIWNLTEKPLSPLLHQKFVGTNESRVMKAGARSWETDVCSVMEHIPHIQIPRPRTKSIATFTCPLSVKSCNQLLLLNGSGSTCHLLRLSEHAIPNCQSFVLHSYIKFICSSDTRILQIVWDVVTKQQQPNAANIILSTYRTPPTI